MERKNYGKDWELWEGEMGYPKIIAMVHLMEDRAEWESTGWPVDPS